MHALLSNDNPEQQPTLILSEMKKKLLGQGGEQGKEQGEGQGNGQDSWKMVGGKERGRERGGKKEEEV